MKTPKIGWIGLGKMGLPMTDHLLRRGYEVRGYDPDANSAQAAASQGVNLAGSVKELAASTDIVITMIPNDNVLHSLVFGSEGLGNLLSDRQILVDMSTVSPIISAEVSDCLVGKAAYLRAPVSGSTETAKSAQLTIIVSGPQAAYDAFLPVMQAMSAKQYYVGAADEARYLKLVLNSLVGASAALLSEALALGKAGGISVDILMEVICDSVVASPLLKYKRNSVVKGDYSPAFTVAQMIKDTTLIANAASNAGLAMNVNALVLQQLERAKVAGLSEHDFFVLVENS